MTSFILRSLLARNLQSSTKFFESAANSPLLQLRNFSKNKKGGSSTGRIGGCGSFREPNPVDPAPKTAKITGKKPRIPQECGYTGCKKEEEPPVEMPKPKPKPKKPRTNACPEEPKPKAKPWNPKGKCNAKPNPKGMCAKEKAECEPSMYSSALDKKNKKNNKKKPGIKLQDGRTIPQLGLGTFNIKPKEVPVVLTNAINAGYRHFDCAPVYENEKEIGEAIKAKIEDQTVKREDLWITSKLWNNFHDPSVVCAACGESLKSLNLEYLDLYLMHSPMGFKEDWQKFHFLTDTKIVKYTDFDYVDTWKAMESLVESGMCKSIGVSNFNIFQLRRLWNKAKLKPVIHQVECHPYLNQLAMRNFCRSFGIKMAAHSPLGSPQNPLRKPNDPNLLNDPEIKGLAQLRGKSPAQILIRYQIDLGNITVPQAVKTEHLEENIAVFDFNLDKYDTRGLLSLERGYRSMTFNYVKDHPYYPFSLP